MLDGVVVVVFVVLIPVWQVGPEKPVGHEQHEPFADLKVPPFRHISLAV